MSVPKTPVVGENLTPSPSFASHQLREARAQAVSLAEKNERLLPPCPTPVTRSPSSALSSTRSPCLR